jgi:hypothetical protein
MIAGAKTPSRKWLRAWVRSHVETCADSSPENIGIYAPTTLAIHERGARARTAGTATGKLYLADHGLQRTTRWHREVGRCSQQRLSS